SPKFATILARYKLAMLRCSSSPVPFELLWLPLGPCLAALSRRDLLREFPTQDTCNGQRFRSRSYGSDAHQIGGTGTPERYAGNGDDSLAAGREALAARDLAGNVDHFVHVRHAL